MNLSSCRRHYCTYFDRHYLAQGLVLVRSIARHDPGAIVWVLCLDDDTRAALVRLGGASVRTIDLHELEARDPELGVARTNRSWVEYLFTLSPCLPRFVLSQGERVDVAVYIDADMWLCSRVAPLFDSMGDGNVLIVEHGFPAWLSHHHERGRFNVGVLCFRNNDESRRCLDWWRERCLEWCRDVVEPGRYADQKYLDEWPARFRGVVVCAHPGVNVAPWNWMMRRWDLRDGAVTVNGEPLVVFHFAALKRLAADSLDSSQVEYAVMPFRLRNRIYGAYLEEIQQADADISGLLPGYSPFRKPGRGIRSKWKSVLLQLAFGARWHRHGGRWCSWSLGLGRWSGRILTWLRAGASS